MYENAAMGSISTRDQVQQRPEIPALLERHEKAVVELNQELDLLRQRIEPILCSPEPPTPVSDQAMKAASESNTQMGHTIVDVTRRVRAMTSAIRSINNRLGV